MALYEYKCEKCGDKFEVLQKFSDEPVTTHENCGGKVERLISAPSFQFKGSGFYLTDYGKGNSGKPADNGSSQKTDSAAGNSSGSSESSSGSTPAATESKPKSSSSDSKPSSSTPKTTSSESK